MVDVHTKEQRSFNMSRIRDKDTHPEIVVRKVVRGLGCRFRLHVSGLPGKPDLVFRANRKIIFVHGCFWHMHKCRYGKVVPKTRKTFWQTKRQGNVARDRKTIKELKTLGWKILIIWECQIRNITVMSQRVKKFLSDR